MAGLEAAIVSKRRNNIPVLFEKSDTLGGQFLLAGKGYQREAFKEAQESRAYQAYKAGVDIRLNTEVTPEVIGQEKPDAMIIASGASPIVPKIKGIENDNVVPYKKVIEKKVILSGKAAVIGGGLVGVEVAEGLAMEDNCDVTIIEMLKGIGN